jgi:hypothetical protein
MTDSSFSSPDFILGNRLSILKSADERAAPRRNHSSNRLLTATEFHKLAEVPPEIEWFANITNP